MYQIIDLESGKILATFDELVYVSRNRNGVWIRTTEPDAEAIRVGGAVYAIFGKKDVEGLTTVLIRRIRRSSN